MNAQLGLDFTAAPARELERTVDLREFDLLVINSSAGKDSLAMLATVARLAKAQGVLDRVHVVHADLGRAEWKGTRELAEAQARHYGVENFHVVNRPQGDLLEQIEKRGMWPSSNARYCTSDQKRGQVAKVINGLAKDHRAGLPKVLNMMGIRAAESPARSKKNPWTENARLSNSKKRVIDWFPIFGWDLEDVWAVCDETPDLVHQAYRLGMPRLSCVFCVFASKPALAIAGKANPELLDRYVEIEEQIGHNFRKDLRLADLRAELEAGRDFGPATSWEM